MTTFTIEQRQQQHVFTAPHWVDVLAKAWILTIAFVCWLKLSRVRSEIYLLTRFDLGRRHIGPIPPAHWRLGLAFICAAVVGLWQECIFNLIFNLTEVLLSKSLGGVAYA